MRKEKKFMENRVKIDFVNKVIEVDGEPDYIDKKIEWFADYIDRNTIKTINEGNCNSSQEIQDFPSEDDSIMIFGVPKEKLSYIVHIRGKEFKFILQNKKLKGGKAEMQVHLALIYCGVCELLCIESNTKELRQICDNYKCLDGNFAANLKRDGYFSIEKGINSEIALTMPGRDALRDYIKELMNTEGKKE